MNFWNQLKSVGKINQKVLPEDIVFISLRDFEKEEKHLIEKHGIKVITTSETRAACQASCTRSFLDLSATSPKKIGVAPGGSRITKSVTKAWIEKVSVLTSITFTFLPPFVR